MSYYNFNHSTQSYSFFSKLHSHHHQPSFTYPYRLQHIRSIMRHRLPVLYTQAQQFRTATTSVSFSARPYRLYRPYHILQAPSTSLPPTSLEASQFVKNVPDIALHSSAVNSPVNGSSVTAETDAPLVGSQRK